MKKKNPKDQSKTNKKPQQNLSLIIPQQYLSLVHEDDPLVCPEERANDTKKYIPEVEPFDIPPEWEEKTEEEINEELLNNDTTIKEKEKEKETINSRKSTKQAGDDKKKKVTLRSKGDNVNKTNTETIEEEKKNNTCEKWKDSMHDELINNLPLSFIKMTENDIKWLSPEEYILNEKIDEDIKRVYPKKDYIKMREDVKEFYKDFKERERIKEKREKEKEKLEQERLEKERLEKEQQEKESKLKKKISKKVSKITIEAKKKEEDQKTITIESNKDTEKEKEKNTSFEDLLSDDSFIAKQNLYKDFLIHMNSDLNIQILKTDERDETDEEYSSRVTETIEKQKETLEKFKANKNKKEKKPVVQRPEDIPRNKIVTNNPSNISVKYIVDKEKLIDSHRKEEKSELVYSNLSLISWLSSIFQFIIDLEITDCVTHNSIFKNIYPQKNGSPIYNPNGHYFVKLYFMGKPRKIEIDDRIPCSKDGEYILPRCQNLCEIWPA